MPSWYDTWAVESTVVGLSTCKGQMSITGNHLSANFDNPGALCLEDTPPGLTHNRLHLRSRHRQYPERLARAGAHPTPAHFELLPASGVSLSSGAANPPKTTAGPGADLVSLEVGVALLLPLLCRRQLLAKLQLIRRRHLRGFLEFRIRVRGVRGLERRVFRIKVWGVD